MNMCNEPPISLDSFQQTIAKIPVRHDEETGAGESTANEQIST